MILLFLPEAYAISRDEMSALHAVEISVNDPLQYLAPLPHKARFYPYGFPVDVASNRRAVLSAAEASFGAFAPRFERPPMRIHVMASEGASGLPPAPVLRGQRNL